MCVHQETNGKTVNCPIRVLGRRVVHLRQHKAAKASFLSTFYHKGKSMVSSVKTSARDSKWRQHSSNTRKHGGYPSNSSTRIRYDAAAPTLWLSPVFQTPKFKKCDAGREPRSRSISGSSLLATRKGMTTKMKHNFKFGNVHGNAYHNVTSTCVLLEYDWASVFSVDNTMGYPLVCFSSQTPHNTTPSTE